MFVDPGWLFMVDKAFFPFLLELEANACFVLE